MYSQNGSSLPLDGELRFDDNISTLFTVFSLFQSLSMDACKPALAEIIRLVGSTALASISWTDLTSVGWLDSVRADLPDRISSSWNYAHYDDKKLAVQLYYDRGLAIGTSRGNC